MTRMFRRALAGSGVVTLAGGEAALVSSHMLRRADLADLAALPPYGSPSRCP